MKFLILCAVFLAYAWLHNHMGYSRWRKALILVRHRRLSKSFALGEDRCQGNCELKPSSGSPREGVSGVRAARRSPVRLSMTKSDRSSTANGRNRRSNFRRSRHQFLYKLTAGELRPCSTKLFHHCRRHVAARTDFALSRNRRNWNARLFLASWHLQIILQETDLLRIALCFPMVKTASLTM